MARYALILILAIGGLWVAFLILGATLNVAAQLLGATAQALAYPFYALPRWWRHRQALNAQRSQQLQLEAHERVRRADAERIDTFRNLHPVRIVGTPDIASVRAMVNLLDNFITASNTFRPTFERDVDTRFRQAQYVPIRLVRRYEEEAGAPIAWEMNPSDLVIAQGSSIVRLYGEVSTSIGFPFQAPALVFNPPAPPTKPIIELPKWNVRLVWANDGTQLDLTSDTLQSTYASEIERLSIIRKHIETLNTDLRRRAQEASEAMDLMDIHLAYESLKFKEFKESILREYSDHNYRYELERDADVALIRETKQEYERHTKNGIQDHFHLSLEMLPLPLPPGYPWAVFYEASERTLQINQRIPLVSDITVKRPDSKKPIAKKDADHFLRRILPAIVLHIAQHVANNDLNDDVDTIAVNGWGRYFEKTTGKLRDAYIATLKVASSKIREIDINKADPLLAFRELDGIFVYNPDEVTPVDPQIRLDKEDKRFVEGREVLSGLAQGQNLGTMDWQDFEHLIRELLSKEYARDGAEVKITRASRDQGVDAIIFNPDPLRGGKYIVQAKRYNNVVELSAVRDLWGTVSSEGASRGILVTTSWFGRDAYEWVSNKSITLIDGQNLLALLTKHGYRFKIEN